METLKQKIEIMQACLDGAEIEYQQPGVWGKATNPEFLWNEYDYRVKPKPMEIWINVYNYPDDFCAKNMHKTKAQAELSATRKCIRTVKFIEVMDD